MHVYSNPDRETDPHALPDIEVFYDGPDYGHGTVARNYDSNGEPVQPGYYWWSCFLGCLPDGEPSGPFDTEAEAIADAKNI
tara:strand:+ start:180 stop:422 length:243 start_codon:yes stop_codon:yes gene_type:complete